MSPTRRDFAAHVEVDVQGPARRLTTLLIIRRPAVASIASIRAAGGFQHDTEAVTMEYALVYDALTQGRRRSSTGFAR